MCPPPRRLALEANGCFMVQVPRGPYRIQGCGAIIAPQWRAPPGILEASIVARYLLNPTPIWMQFSAAKGVKMSQIGALLSHFRRNSSKIVPKQRCQGGGLSTYPGHRAMRRRQELARLRARQQGLSGRLLSCVPSRATSLRGPCTRTRRWTLYQDAACYRSSRSAHS